MANEMLRAKMKEDKIFMWQLADELGLNETTVIKRFRHELKPRQIGEVLAAIQKIKMDRRPKQ